MIHHSSHKHWSGHPTIDRSTCAFPTGTSPHDDKVTTQQHTNHNTTTRSNHVIYFSPFIPLAITILHNYNTIITNHSDQLNLPNNH